jgi:hypothetical protein
MQAEASLKNEAFFWDLSITVFHGAASGHDAILSTVDWTASAILERTARFLTTVKCHP